MGIAVNSPQKQQQQHQRLMMNDRSSMKCPSQYEENSEKAKTYIEVDKHFTEQSINQHLKSFRNETYDKWGLSYNTVKGKMFKFKSKAYASVKNGDTIYESACGIGLNLFMTLEILKEVHNVTNITVYGNDFVPNSVQIANELMDAGLLAPWNGKKGIICQGDSTNLSFVPSNAFDVVYTGYITPNQDPFQTNLTIKDV